MFKVMLTDLIFPDFELEEEEIRRIGASLSLATWGDEAGMVAALKEADGLLNHFAPLTRRVLEQLPKCRVISRCGVGYDNIDVEAATELGILVAHVRDYCIEEASTHTFALLLACARRLFHIDRAVRRGAWDHAAGRPMHNLACQTIGIVGLGKIGNATANKARAFGMKVLAFDPYARGAGPNVEMVPFDRLVEASDYICIHAALTDETRGLFSDRAFDRMKPTAYLINGARGPIVDEDALLRALREGKIAGAAVDTMAKEPPGAENPLLKLDNLIVTSHVSWYSEESIELLRRENVRAVVDTLQKGRPKYLVNPEALQHARQKNVERATQGLSTRVT